MAPQSPPAEPARVLALLGPTAVGKSAAAHALALRLDGEIVVADPFQRYRGLEIAADAPRAADHDEVRYHLVGDLDLHETSSAAGYAQRAHAVIDDVLARGRVPIVSGGTGLYVRAALADLGFPDEPPPAVRRSAEDRAGNDLPGAVAELARLDPVAADRVDLRNPRRVARALALARSGIAAPVRDALWAESTRHPTVIVALVRERHSIDGLIADRVARELADGLVAEIAAALDRPGGISREAAQIIGVAEVRALRAGTLDPGALADALAARTRRLARSQLTWLRKTPGVTEVDVDAAGDVVGHVERLWNAATARA